MVKWLARLLFIVGSTLFASNLYFYVKGVSAVKQVEVRSSPSVKAEGTRDSSPSIEVGSRLGELFIPRLEALIPIYEGTSARVLDEGIGHLIRSHLPGEEGRIVLSGHRDTVFRHLNQVELGDELQVLVGSHAYIYTITELKIVDAHDRKVLSPSPSEVLTLTTCYPFNYIGDAPKRYIVTAKRI